MSKNVSPEELFFDEALAEIERARAKFPTNEDRLAAIHEESGEVASALLGVKYGTHTWADVAKEAVQLAATACRLAIEGDAGIAVPPELDPAVAKDVVLIASRRPPPVDARETSR